MEMKKQRGEPNFDRENMNKHSWRGRWMPALEICGPLDVGRPTSFTVQISYF
jgi:hypothetical protein